MRLAIGAAAGNTGSTTVPPAIILRQIVEQRIEPAMSMILKLAMLAVSEGAGELGLIVAIE